MSRLGVLAERNFRLLFLARTISYFGTNLAPIAVAFGVLSLGGSATQVGLAFAAWTLAQVSTLLVGGVVADRLPRRLVMIGSDGANFCVRAAMGALLVSGHARVWELIVLQGIGGAATAFYSPASTGLVPQTVRPERLQQANGLMSIARYAAFPVGAATGGAIVATIGSGWALFVDAGTYAASVLLLSRMFLPSAERSVAAPNFPRELREGWSAFTEHTWVWLLTGWISLYFLITYAPFFVLGPAIADKLPHGKASWAMVVTGEAIGALVGGIVALRVQPRRAMFWIGVLFIPTSIQSVLLAVRAPFVTIAAAAALAGFAFSYGTVVWDTCLQRLIAPDKLSRVSAYNWMGAMAFLPAGYALAGPVAAAIGTSTYLWIGAGWAIVSTLAVLTARDVRTFRTRAAPDHLATAPATT
jgi:predicted MFS family arabinose efflux permease